jgi:hypothetical protein
MDTTLTGAIRIFETLLIVHLFFSFFHRNKIQLSLFVQVLIYSLVVQFVIALIDIRYDGIIKSILVLPDRLLADRFTGLNVEPRVFGRIAGFCLLVFFTLNTSIKLKKTYKILFIIIGFSIILLTVSTSALIITMICLLFYGIFLKKLSFKISVAIIIFYMTFLYTVWQNETYRGHTLDRVASTLVEEEEMRQNNIPDWMSGLEVFDAAGAAFFYFNPEYLFLGVGPNTISIPSSPFLSKRSKAIYGETIDSIPHMGFLQFLSRSGIIGILLISMFLFKIGSNLKKINIEFYHLFILIIIFNSFVMTNMFYMIVGIAMGLTQRKYA